MKKVRRTRVFQYSKTHSSYIPDIFHRNATSDFAMYLHAYRVKGEKDGLEALADVRKAHLAFWAMVAEEAKTLQGFSLT